MAKKNIAISKHSRAARRATSPSINTDKSLKNVALPTDASPSSSKTASHRPSVLAAHHSAGVTKKSKRGRQLSAKARRRQEKGLEMAEAILERTSKKVEKSMGRSKVIQARSKAWDDINKAAAGENALTGEGGDDEGADGAQGWETDEEMDGDNAEGRIAAVPRPIAAAVLAIDDDDEIL